MPRAVVTTAIALAAGLSAAFAPAAHAADELNGETGPQALEFFEREIRPILADNCYECHGPERQRSDLRADHIQFLLEGGETGPALAPGEVEQSRLIEAVRYDDPDFQMPPRSRLEDDEVAALEKWVAMGAPWPEEEPPAAEGEEEAFDLDQRLTEHWAWQPVANPEPPEVSRTDAVENPIDRFIVAKLEANDLAPAERADRRTLIRRLSFDLTGLPPTAEQVHAFVNDDSEDAYEKLVDRLLASPRFGERWARHWMDLVRYGETHGHEFDYPIHHAWRYRDYLIRAFNDDLPYDQFVTEHIAGDLIDEPRINDEGFSESILGTGFYWLGEAVHAPVDVRADQADRIDNQIDVLTKTFVGLTVSCARCHDHMFDAISTKDYYALYGIMASSRRREAHLDRNGQIDEKRQAIAKLREEGGDALEALLADPQQAEAHAERHLTAAADVLGDEQADAAAVAERHEVDPAELDRWLAALRDEAVNHEAHPLRPFREAARAGDAFGEKWASLRENLTQQARQRDGVLEGGEIFTDFADGYEGWRATGQAFDDRPTLPGEWDVLGGVQPGRLVHSGVAGPRMRGVIRSPTFTIDSDFILYRMAGRDANIRLIIDNYFMDVFNALLFGGIRFDVQTEGELRWHAQNVSRFRGRRAHIEVIDDGDGWVALDQVAFADGGIRARTNPLADRLDAAATAESPADLAATYADLLGQAVAERQTQDADPHLQQLLDWTVEHKLLPTGDREPLDRIAAEVDALQQETPHPVRALATVDGDGIDERVFIRGSHENLGDVVPRRFLTGIAGKDQPAMPDDGSGRLQLARRITDPDNPFYSRVIVNRLWHHLFGEGIVPTVDNFGVLGEDPSHPELLDYLATRFLEEGQSLKAMIRLMVTSSTYRMAAEPGPGDEADPKNRLLHRMPIRRLEGEAIRDAILAISGELDEKRFGPSVEVHLTEFMSGRGRPGESGPLDGNGRRSLYTKIRRNFLPPRMLAFDMPVPFSTVGDRSVSNVPAQALILLNDPFVLEQARHWADRVLAAHGDESPRQRVERMYLTAFARPPSEHELEYAMGFFDEQAEARGVGRDAPAVWADFAHVLMNVKEFIFIH